MARIELGPFGGIIPSLDGYTLPANAAQTAHNADLSSGTIKPWTAVNEFSAMHDSDGDMNAGFSADDIAIITKAGTVTKDKTVKMCIPWAWNQLLGDGSTLIRTWVTIYAHTFVRYIDAADTEQLNEQVETLIPYGLDYTDNGFVLQCYYNTGSTFSCDPNIQYEFFGPIYRFVFMKPDTYLYSGGPDDDYTFPNDPQPGDDQIPAFSIPLEYPKSMALYVDGNAGYVSGDASSLVTTAAGSDSVTVGTEAAFRYGTLRASDYSGPQISGKYKLPGYATDSVTKTLIASGSSAQFWFDCGYRRARPKDVYYIQQMVDSSDRDGPESGVSEEITVEPGEIVKLSTPLQSGYTKNRLFRSNTADAGYYKLEDVNTTIFYDNFIQSLTTELPPNGNVPHATVADAVKGALAHPAGYYVYYFGNELRPSSEWIDLERPWACPEEYAIAFENTIDCIALMGADILVFTSDGVFRVTGQHPGRLSRYLISDKPILDKLTLFTTNDMIGWVNEEGVAVYTGGGVSLLTSQHYRADEWQDMAPAAFAAYTNDRTVCLFNGDDSSLNNLRFDLRADGTTALSTFTSFQGNKEAVWKGKIELFQKPVSWYAARVLADDYPVRLKFYRNGVPIKQVAAKDSREFLLPKMPSAKQWEIEVAGLSEIRKVIVGTSITEV